MNSRTELVICTKTPWMPVVQALQRATDTLRRHYPRSVVRTRDSYRGPAGWIVVFELDCGNSWSTTVLDSER